MRSLTEFITLKVDADLKLLATRAAARADVSASEWIRQLILRAVVEEVAGPSPQEDKGP